jgi:hypothetical protein
MPKTDTEEGQRMSTTQDYQAAEQLLRRPARPGELVIGDKVRPQWIDGGARFWYAVSNGVGRRFVLVDPAAGTREPAFDHALLAAALAAAGGADEGCTPDADRVHEAHDVGGEVLGPVAVRGTVRVAVAALSRRVAVQRRREMPQTISKYRQDST